MDDSRHDSGVKVNEITLEPGHVTIEKRPSVLTPGDNLPQKRPSSILKNSFENNNTAI
jgi:hypothetical protein